jgi:hypothetical protein
MRLPRVALFSIEFGDFALSFYTPFLDFDGNGGGEDYG